MMEIFNMLGGMGQAQQQVSQQLGTDPNQAASALEAAVPLVLGALTRNAQTPEGAASLENALNDHTGDTIGLFQQGQMPDSGEAQRMLGHIFGTQQNAAVNAVSQRAGISPQLAMQILMMVAPLILNYLARSRSQGGNVGASTGGNMGGMDIGSILGGILGGGGLGSVLGGMVGGNAQQPQYQQNQYQQPQGSVLGGGSVIPGYPGGNQVQQGNPMGNVGGVLGTLNNVLDRDGDGSALDELIGMFGGRRG